MVSNKIKSKLHHWWPRVLSKYWVSSDGKLSTIRPDGKIIRAPAGNFGAINNAHNVLLDEFWSFSFEEQFNEADNSINELIFLLSELKYHENCSNKPIEDRICGHEISDINRIKLSKIASSLIARSPRTRNSIRVTARYYRERFNMSNPEPNDALISGSQSNLYNSYVDIISSGGRWGVLFSSPNEFIAGDGFLNTFPATPDRPLHPKFLIPLTPNIAIIYDRPSSYRNEPKIVTLQLSKEETNAINYITQIYSKDFIFFRDALPELAEAYSQNEFLMFNYHSHPWIDYLFHCISQYIKYGPNQKGKILDKI